MSAASPATQRADRMLAATWKDLIDAQMDRLLSGMVHPLAEEEA